jgi:hypothetical protein
MIDLRAGSSSVSALCEEFDKVFPRSIAEDLFVPERK